MGQSTQSHPAGVPTVRNLKQTQSISRDAGAGAQGRLVSGKAQPQECQSTVRTNQGRKVRRRLQPAHRLYTLVARRARQFFTSLLVADLCTRGGLSIRLERKRSADRRPVPMHPSLPYEAVRQSLIWLVAYPRQGHEMLFDAHTGGSSHRRARCRVGGCRVGT